MEHLHLFETQVSHDSLYEGDNYKEPWIAYTLDNASVTFNKPHDYSKDYFTIEALEDGNVYFKYLSFAPTANQRYIEYSKDNGTTWSRTTNVDNTQVVMTIPLLTGEKALVRGDNDAFGTYDDGSFGFYGSCFYSDIKFNASGNIMSLLHGDNFINGAQVLEYEYTFLNLFYDGYAQWTGVDPAECMIVNAKNLILPATELTDMCYCKMFMSCTSLKTAPELPATTLASYCYTSMFEGCASLTTAPSLPATTLAYSCYSSMFSNCTLLTAAPELPATTLTESCYEGMFYGCSSLIVVSELPATTLANFCYSGMFYGCSSLTTAPALPATTLASSCYSSMFSGCNSLTTAPVLPATTLAPGCYNSMFIGCTLLTTAPALPATTLTESCYSEMFRNCTSLTSAPKLPANTLANSCYSSMFWGCTSLTTVPELLATTLTERCYYRMFRGCKSLTTAPELPATMLAVECYRIMFTDCTQLNSITMLATNISATDCLTNWVNGVAATGTFVKAPLMTSLTTGTSGIPEGWTVMEDTEYLTLTALGNGTITITIPDVIDSTYATSLSYSKNKLNWTDTIIDNTEQTISISVSNGDNIYLKGDAIHWCNDSSYGTRINSTENINVSGNIMSLLYGDYFKDKTTFPEGSQYTFNELFRDNTHLINAENLILPATTLTNRCYSSMFWHCTSLTTAPDLPATELSSSCYDNMFRRCSALTAAPDLPATVLAQGCYGEMFKECTSLTAAPELPATKLATFCYQAMFSGCTSLTTTPALPATTLENYCYYQMFAYCNSLTTAPELPAPVLVNSCYYQMFYNCSKLNSIIMFATDISATNCLYNWVGGVAATGTFVKAPSMTSLTTGFSGIPTGWTIMEDTEYLTISALEDGEITITIPSNVNSTYATSLSYSKDKLTWNETIVDDTNQTITIPVSSGENVYLKGIGRQWGTFRWSNGSNINSSADIIVSGNIMSLLYGDSFKDKTAFQDGTEYIFMQLFKSNKHLINVDNLILPATTLTPYCYYNMFYGCSSLTTAPDLPATTLATYCYYGIFEYCSLLTSAPELPATMLANGCYYQMFYNCSSLTTATELPATTLSDECYRYMFQGCTSLENAPALPATTLTNDCYNGMFDGCTSLTTAPELSATTLDVSCYENMFNGCTALITAPALPATTLASSCYRYMFGNCESLITAPKLPATTLADFCYYEMFSGCTSLTIASELPATTLAQHCYYSMFMNCRSLTTAPELSATTLASNCYGNMFNGCSKLNSITMLATNISAFKCLTDWVNGVASTGVFVKAPSMTSLPTGTSGIPSGWTVLDDTEYLTLSALGNGTITITIPSCIDSTYATSLSYSKDKSNWTETTVDNTEQTITISVSNGENVYLKGIAQQLYNFNSSDGIHINSSTNINASGNVMSILYGDNFKDKIAFSDESQYALGGLFRGNTHLISAENLILPATTLAKGCYYRMFSDCTALTSTPLLRATTLADYCYSHMFDSCISLVNAPELPATTLADYCYSHMFDGCSSLYTEPTLPATTLAHSCYSGMFSGCNELITAPALPANTLATSCYSDMFSGCGNLTNAPELPAMELAIRCYDSMFRDCMSLRTAPELPATTLVSRCYCNMFYGCTWLTTVPELRATTLAEGCYQYMFSGCINLNSIAMFATDISASNCLYNWVVGVAPTGVFVKAPSMTSLTTGTSGIPSGWNVVDDSDYLTLTALSDGEIRITIPDIIDQNYVTSLSYSKDKSNWTDTIIDNTEQTISIPVSNGDNVYLKGIAQQLCNDGSDGVCINSTANINVSGNIMSLLYGDKYKNKIVFPNGSQYTFGYLFKGNTHLINAENIILQAITLTYGCYFGMFQGCTSLTTVPELPVTTLVERCYDSMFNGCSSLTTTTELPATTLASRCYESMFSGCSSLTAAPELPVIALAPNCYASMFKDCTSLTTAPELPATTLSNSCYSSMFSGCTSLTTAPELPATTLASSCYWNMFSGCTAITTVPTLPVTTLASSCYSSMFEGCASLTTAPELPATALNDRCYSSMFKGCTALTASPTLSSMTLAPSCYSSMFSGCTALKSAPILPATTLTESCYHSMFKGCTAITVMPKLPATTLSPSCYREMFSGCTSLNESSELRATTLTNYCYYRMFYNCKKLNNITMLATDISAQGCLGNWVNGVASKGTFVKVDSTSIPTNSPSGIPTGWTTMKDMNYLTLTALGNGSIIITIPAQVDSSVATSISYSKNKSKWVTTAINSNDQTIAFSVSKDENVYLKGIAKQWNNVVPNPNNPNQKLLYNTDIDSTANINASGNIMSLLYGDNFEGKTTFPDGSVYTFRSLFSYNTHLVNAENLILPATTLSTSCYQIMFWHCTSLVAAPELPAPTLVITCYHRMLEGCSNLRKITMLATNISAKDCLANWVSGVASTGTFTKASSASIPSGVSGIPSGWIVKNKLT